MYIPATTFVAMQESLRPRFSRLIIGPAAGCLAYLALTAQGLDHTKAATILVTLWMGIWWITEVIDLGVTSFLPFLLFPLLGVLDANTVAAQYMEQTIFLFVGGFFMAYAMERWNLHQRLAFTIILKAGSTPSRVLLGIMVTTFLVSMWISNTATTVMLLSAVLAIVRHEHLFPKSGHARIATGYLLALAYAASIGGMATLVGTPPNMILAGFMEKIEPGAVNFNRWFVFGFPFALTFGTIAFFFIRHRFIAKAHNLEFDRNYIREKLKALGPLQPEERRVMLVFFLAVFGWFTRIDLDFGAFRLPGWSNLLPAGKMIKDATVAIFAAMLLFLIPAKKKDAGALLNWSDVTRLPFRIILLFGSGFALAEAFERTGLAEWLAGHLHILHGMPAWVMVLGVATMATALSEFASNVASVQLMLPILAPLAVSLEVEPLMLMFPATIAASFGYMMPVATAANTIVYGTGYIPVRQMMSAGLVLNIIGILLLTLFSQLIRF